MRSFSDYPRSSRRRRLRRGTIYLVVLMTATLVTMLGLSAIVLARLRGRAGAGTGDAVEAQFYAQSATEIGRLWISQDPNWRSTRAKGYWATNQPIGKGSFSLYVYDPNGSGALNQNNTDPVVLVGTGYKGNATQQVQVQLTPSNSPLTCLNVAACAGGSTTFSGTTLNSFQPIGCNADVSAATSTINASIEAVTATGGTFVPPPTTGVNPRSMPDPANAFTFYTSNGTSVSFGSIPQIAGIATISGRVFSAQENPCGGGTNAKGIYVIDCAGQQLAITNSRFVGTLVLLNPGPGSSVQGGNLFQPGPDKYPVLLVQGSIAISQGNGTISEATIGANLNGATPYNGLTNGTNTDSYPSLIQGLVYVSGGLSTSGHPVINGVLVIGGAWSSSSSIDFTYDSSYLRNPPPGFTQPTKMVAVPGSWQ